jgi:IS5 family transposase
MVRIPVLNRLYNLSDEQTEYQLLDRMSYKRFCGLANAINVPDRTTVWTFENRIGEVGAQVVFDARRDSLKTSGYSMCTPICPISINSPLISLMPAAIIR